MSASPSSVKEWNPSELSHFDTILFDCDGVLWHETEPIKGANATLMKLQSEGKRLLFATNNSGKSRQTYVEKFKTLGFTIQVDENSIFTSSQTAAHYVASLPRSVFDPDTQKVFVVGESGIGLEMKHKGIQCIEALHEYGSKHMSKTELSKIPLDPSVGAVVVGIDEQLTYTKAAVATAYLNQVSQKSKASPHVSGVARSDASDRHCLFISTNQDSNLPTAGHTLPGAGSCVTMIATASGRTPINMGKPESGMLDLAVELLKLDKSRILMVGDRLDTDILFGEKGGVKTLFVSQTGIHNQHDVDALKIYPTYIANDVSFMVKH